MKERLLIFVISTQAILSQGVEARDLKASLPILPLHSEVAKNGYMSGGFVEIAQAINDVYTQGDISIKLYPFARSLKNIESGYADFHLPMMKRVSGNIHSRITYATECITNVTFVLYSRADAPPIDIQQLHQYVIDTQRGHKDLFEFKIQENNTIAHGIQKLLKGRIDGYIMEQNVVDNYIKKHQIDNIRRTFFGEWESCVVIPRDERRDEIDRIVSNALRKLKQSGRLQKIAEKIHRPYIDWQPYLTIKKND